MPAASLVDPPPGLAVGASRGAVLAQLREAPRPRSAAEVADRTGLHVNTARFHLDGLVADGLAKRSAEGRSAPGRPRILYTACARGAGPHSYRLLAEMLTGMLETQDGAASAAVATGRVWGRRLAERETSTGADALRGLADVLDAVGFQPSIDRDAAETRVRLHHCPFRQVAERHAPVVCGLHEGLIDGVLEERRASLELQSLEPFVTPDVCLARLRPTSPVRAGQELTEGRLSR